MKKIDLFYQLNNGEETYIGSTIQHKTIKSAIESTMSFRKLPTYKNQFFHNHGEEMVFNKKRFSGVIDKK